MDGWSVLQGQGWWLLCVGIVAGLLVARSLQRIAVHRRIGRHRRLGADGEEIGLRVLRRAGFRILGGQQAGSMQLLVDGRLQHYPVRIDALVERGRRRFVAEIKHGGEAAELATRATRRQVLEYLHAFDVDGVLLVDAGRGRIAEISLPERSLQRSR